MTNVLRHIVVVVAIAASGWMARAQSPETPVPGGGDSCKSTQTVTIDWPQTMENFAERPKVLSEGIRQAAKLAIDRVIGTSLSSKSEAQLTLENDVARSQFQDQQSSSSGGFITYKIDKEIYDENRKILNLSLSITVCVPKTEQELAADKELKERRSRAPQRVTSDDPVFFDTKTGAPNIWYWRSKTGDLEFYDNAGFQPQTGEALVPITREVVESWHSAMAARKAEQSKSEAQAKAAQSAAADCDKLAANPYDLQKPREVEGTDYAILKLNADAAVAACQQAIAQTPGDARLLYQLGRAWQSKDPQTAAKFLGAAVDRKYAVAFDNLGWLLIKLKKPLDGRAILQRGADLGDPSSMFSLAALMERDLARKPSAGAKSAAIELYRKAAALGHKDAQRRLDEIAVDEQQNQAAEADRAARAERRRAEDDAARQLFLGILGGALRGQ